MRAFLPLLLLIFALSSTSQNAWYTDSLTKALPSEKDPLKKCIILLSLSEEWRERDPAVSDKYFDAHYETAQKINSRTDQAELILKRSFAHSNRKNVKVMKAELDSVKDYILQSKNNFLIGKYWCAYANYLRMDHEETDQSHKQIVNLLQKSIDILQKYDLEEAAKAYYLLVTFYSRERDDPAGLNQYLDAFVKVAEKLDNARLKAKYLHQAGLLHHYYTLRDAVSFNCYVEALQNYCMVHDSLNIAGMKINIGERTTEYDDREKGIAQMREGIEICRRNSFLNTKKANQNIANACSNIADHYGHTRGKKNECFDAFRKALYYNKKAGNSYNEPLILGNMAVCYGNFDILDTARMVEEKALELRIKFGNREGELFSYGSLANITFRAGLYDTSIAYAYKSLKLADEIKIHKHDDNSFIALFQSFEKLKDYEKAFYYLRRHTEFKDSIKKIANEREINKLINKQKEELAKAEFDKKHTLDEAEIERNRLLLDKGRKELLLLEQENNLKAYALEKSKTTLRQRQMESEVHKKEIAVLNAETRLKDAEAQKKEASIRQQRTVILSIGCGGCVTLLLLLLAVKGYRQKQKDNHEIASQKLEVERQKHLVDEKNKEILDSISYAKRLQEAILPPASFVNEHFPDNFILYQPKDIVAGDFYWMHVKEKNPASKQMMIAAADSTGHGVPGAMVSVVCSNALNRSVKEFSLSESSDVLNKTRELVLETFEKSASDVKDGMDISLLSVTSEHNGLKKIQWSGANNPLWYIEDSVLKEIKPDKQPIGKSDHSCGFTANNLQVSSGSVFYLFTDGYADQFGGPKGKKFKYKQLEELLVSIHMKPMVEQKNILVQKFNEWKGNLEQVDDVCIIGIKL